jgi:hypothetical protein
MSMSIFVNLLAHYNVFITLKSTGYLWVLHSHMQNGETLELSNKCVPYSGQARLYCVLPQLSYDKQVSFSQST